LFNVGKITKYVEIEETKKKIKKECEKRIQENFGTEEEFIEGEMDWKYRTEIPWGMVKIIMSLLE